MQLPNTFETNRLSLKSLAKIQKQKPTWDIVGNYHIKYNIKTTHRHIQSPSLPLYMFLLVAPRDKRNSQLFLSLSQAQLMDSGLLLFPSSGRRFFREFHLLVKKYWQLHCDDLVMILPGRSCCYQVFTLRNRPMLLFIIRFGKSWQYR